MNKNIGQVIPKGIKSPEDIFKSVTQSLKRPVISSGLRIAAAAKVKRTCCKKLRDKAKITNVLIVNYKNVIIYYKAVM